MVPGRFRSERFAQAARLIALLPGLDDGVHNRTYHLRRGKL